METFERLDGYYSGCLLVATPNMMDHRFRESVIFMFSHSPEGAMGIIINKPILNLKLSEFIKQFKINDEKEFDTGEIFYGGPVEVGRGFILHSSDYAEADSTITINKDLNLTSTVSVLEKLGAETGPKDFLIALGYAGWSAGQLEKEIEQHSWLVSNASSDLVFNPNVSQCWQSALNKIGIKQSNFTLFGGSV